MKTSNKTKGIILAGGKGTRLAPITNAVSKQLLPVYDKPLIHYSVSLLLQAGIREILIIVSSEENIPLFKAALKGANASFEYIVQKEAIGLAHAFILGEEFIGQDNVCLVLGDNIFHGNGVNTISSVTRTSNNAIFGVKVKDSFRYGVMQFKTESYNFLPYDRLVKVVEKPREFVSNWAVPGIYFFDNTVIERAKNVKPSERGELEIVDVINSYISEDKMFYDFLSDDTIWFDCGTFDSLIEAGNYVQAIQHRTPQIIGNIYI